MNSTRTEQAPAPANPFGSRLRQAPDGTISEIAPSRPETGTELARSSLSESAAPASLRRQLASEALAEGVNEQLSRENIQRVAIAQIKPLPTRLQHNFGKITEYIDRAVQAEAQLVVFPELTIPGYLALDHFKNEAFVEANLQVLKEVIGYTAGKPLTAVVGFVNAEPEPDTGRTRYYNAAAVIRDGRLLAVVDKTLLPDYDIFWERRYFESAKERKVVELLGNKLGIQICEDLWDRDYPIKVGDDLKQKGAEMMINLSASPFEAGKYRTRYELVAAAAKRHKVPFIYANMVGAQDGYEGEVIFDGSSMIVDAEGKLLALGRKFEEELVVADFHASKRVELPDWACAEEVHGALVMGLRDYCARNGFTRVYIGLSGGIDSAVTAALAVEALGAENVIGVTMPSHITSEETKSDALLLAESLGIRCDVRPISKIYKAWEEEALQTHGALDGLTKQNLQARLRGNILMEYANQDRKGLVVSTGNKTELGVGYCTLYGDMSGGLSLLADVDKRLVYELADLTNARAGRDVIPQTTIARPPTAELEPGQTDEANLPAPYSILAPLVDDLAAGVEGLRALAKRYPEEAVRATDRLMKRAEFKRRQAAPGVRTSGKAFGSGRRYPVDDRFDEFSFPEGERFRRAVLNAKDWIRSEDKQVAAA